MNPYASEFVPSIKMDASEQRKYEQQHLSQEIIDKKQVIAESNNELIILHKALNEEYSNLSYQLNRRENNEYGCYSKEDIDLLHTKYTQQSSIYYKQYAKFNNLQAELIALQQRLYRLLLAPTVTITTDDKNNNNKNNDMITTTTTTTTTNTSSTLRVLDGINNISYSPPSTPCNILPPILESDAEESSAWNDYDDVENDNVNDLILEEYNDTNSIVSTTAITLNLPDDIFNNECNKKQLVVIKEKEEQKEKEKEKEKEEQNEEKENKEEEKEYKSPKAENTEIPNHNEFENEFENKINSILDDITYCDIKSLCDNFIDLMISIKCASNQKLIEILIDCIIVHGVNNKPNFFGAKYSLLCQSIISFIHSNKTQINEDLDELIWICCYDTFKKLQFGNDLNKFINIMIIIAELYNSNLLESRHIFDYVFESILCQQNLKEILCENDIEGIYEIYTRCHCSLTTKNNQKKLHKYLNIMNEIKNWEKFQNEMNMVPFYINQMINK